jgi:hypothetical protein
MEMETRWRERECGMKEWKELLRERHFEHHARPKKPPGPKEGPTHMSSSTPAADF